MSSRTPVLFRVSLDDSADVYALFPTLHSSPGYVTCYQHVGQHSEADLRGCLQASRAADLSEYRALRRELESAPYKYRLRLGEVSQ